ncbi:MAG: hypothetical protein HY710_07585 [Candidatus Latescibacteria bacterium]|nr:hypothetical protein [Candidatus Latescibacterota bacterium]
MVETEERLGNASLEVHVRLDDRIVPHSLINTRSGRRYADMEYQYRIAVNGAGDTSGLTYTAHHRARGADGTERLVLHGVTPGGIRVEHVFSAPPHQPYLEETITLTNATERTIQIDDIVCAFRKRLTDLSAGFHLVAVPYRIQVDGKVHDYDVDDLLKRQIQDSDWIPPWIASLKRWGADKGRSEGWVWTDESEGLLVIKYNQEMIEYSMVDVDEEECLTFGGVGLCLYGEPTAARTLEPGCTIQFGTTRYILLTGGWREGYRVFKAFMNEHGHGLPPNYNPPVHWNELFDVGWYHSDREQLFTHYTRDVLFYECQKAAELGCEQLYLDPGWEVCEGTTLWDEERLGRVSDFVEDVKEKFGLTVAFRTIGRVYRNEFPPAWYIQKTEQQEEYVPYSEVYAGRTRVIWEVCTEYEPWKQEKLKRLLAIVEGGIKFILFDEFEWRGPCYNEAHGHAVPSTPDEHARSVYWLIEEIHKRHPDVLIEAHDPIWAWYIRYVPTYYQHGLPHAYDENWGFEFMWNPIEDLTSGKARCLYYYNLAYDIPLYDHLTMEGDNDHCLSFWWYASTVRHLGLGGKKGLNSPQENETRYQAYKQAMAVYLTLKDLYTRGTFEGVDELTHLHYLPGTGRAVLNAFNLDHDPLEKAVTLDLRQIGIDPRRTLLIDGAEWRQAGSQLQLHLTIPPMSPLLVTIRQA